MNKKLRKENNLLLHDKIIITENSECEICMLDSNISNNNQKYDILNYPPKVDLIITFESDESYNKHVNKCIDKHTLISKMLSEDVIYVEDSYKDIHILINDSKVFILKGHGLETKLIKINDMQNT